MSSPPWGGCGCPPPISPTQYSGRFQLVWRLDVGSDATPCMKQAVEPAPRPQPSGRSSSVPRPRARLQGVAPHPSSAPDSGGAAPPRTASSNFAPPPAVAVAARADRRHAGRSARSSRFDDESTLDTEATLIRPPRLAAASFQHVIPARSPAAAIQPSAPLSVATIAVQAPVRALLGSGLTADDILDRYDSSGSDSEPGAPSSLQGPPPRARAGVRPAATAMAAVPAVPAVSAVPATEMQPEIAQPVTEPSSGGCSAAEMQIPNSRGDENKIIE